MIAVLQSMETGRRVGQSGERTALRLFIPAAETFRPSVDRFRYDYRVTDVFKL